MRPRCDPFDISATRAAIASGATTERRAYETYAATAARPYARSSWGVMLRSRKPAAEMDREAGPRHSSGRLNSSKSGAPVKPSNVLTLTGDSVSLSVNRGALHARDGGADRVYEPRAVKPSAIVMTGWGGVIKSSSGHFWRSLKASAIPPIAIAPYKPFGAMTLFGNTPEYLSRNFKSQGRQPLLVVAQCSSCRCRRQWVAAIHIHR